MKKRPDSLRGSGASQAALWPIALTFLSWLLYHVVCIATALNFAMINAESAHMTPVERTRSSGMP